MSARRARCAAVIAAVLTAVAGCAAPEAGTELRLDGDSQSAADGGDRPPRTSVPAHQEVAATSGLSPICPAPKAGQRFSAAQLNGVMRRLTMPQWRSADVGASAPLSDGRVAWAFGDTQRPDGYDPLVAANSLAISSGACFSQLLVRGHQPLITLDNPAQVCWPTSIAALPAAGGDHLYVACSRIVRRPGGLLEFSYVGASLARFWVPKGGTPVSRGVTALTPDVAGATQINWGAALLTTKDHLYVYGSQQPKGSTRKRVMLARTGVGMPRPIAHWEFWSGDGWTRDDRRAAPVLGSDPGVSQAFSVQRIGDRHVLVSKEGGEFGRRIGAWTASAPTGPWRLASTVPYRYDDGSGYVTYQPLAHPELPTADGTLLVSLSRNPKSFADLRAHPDRARPVFVELPAPR